MMRWTVALAAWLVTCAGPAWADDDGAKGGPPAVEVDAQVAFGGYYRERGFASALIEVRSNAGERRAEVALQGASVSRAVEVDLTQGARKRLQLTAPLSELGTLWVSVRDPKSGDQLARRTPRMRRLIGDQPLLVYVGQRPPGLKRRSMEELIFGQEDDDEQQDDPLIQAPTPDTMAEQPQVVRATLSELPRSWMGYDAVTALFWSHPTVDRLAPEQVEALRRWVMTGGHLLVAVDDDWRQVRGSALAPLLPAALTGVETVEGQALEALLSDNGGAQVSVERAPVAQVTPRRGATSVSGVGGDASGAAALTWMVGDGRVTLWRVGWERAGVEWPMEAWRGWATQPTQPQASEELWRVAKDDEPRLDINVVALILVLLAYVLYIGPIDYLVLRSLKRLEWTVWTYSGSILLFGALAWVVMATSQSDAGLVSRTEVSHWFVKPGEAESEVRVQTLTAYFTTERERIAVEPLEDGSALWLDQPRTIMSLLNTEQQLKGIPARLEATAAAYALLPVHIETFMTRPSPLEIEVGAPSEEGWPQLARVRNRTGQGLTRCRLMTSDYASEAVFDLPADAWVEPPRLIRLNTAPSDLLTEGLEGDTSYRSPLRHLGSSLRLGGQQGGVWRMDLVCQAERPLLGEEPTKLGDASVERRDHALTRFVFDVQVGGGGEP